MTVKNKFYYTVCGVLLVWGILNLIIAATSKEILSGIVEKIEIIRVPAGKGVSISATVVTVVLGDESIIKVNRDNTSLSLGDKVTITSSYSPFRGIKEYKLTGQQSTKNY